MGSYKGLMQKIEQARRLAYPDFDKIILTPQAVQILAHLFLNPDCQSDIDLSTFITKKSVKLKHLSLHIITAAPATLAQYAKDHDKLKINERDILQCFALNHAHAIEQSHIDTTFSPSYSLTHLLNIGKIINITSTKTKKMVDVEKKANGHRITFKNVVVPNALKIFKNQKAFHHFGVVIAIANTPNLVKLAHKITAEQKKQYFIYKMNQRAGKNKKIIINMQDKTIFQKNVMGKIIAGLNTPSSPPNINNIRKGKITFSK